MSQAKQHYRLWSGQLKFQNEDNDVINININAVHASPNGNVNYVVLNQAQQALQIRLAAIAGDVKVVDIFITGFSYLGYMDSEEFNEGHKPLED